ncbi:MAG: DegT/DnrJ/EryC1/StrS family aminotransferase [Candidatus Woesebacteria bacterium]|nr:DegT/DnrJ/EryC1/StrS family aminotransferase [Candidatus Woesebacteria bacterium]
MAKNNKFSSEENFLPTSSPVLDGNEKRYVGECFKTNWISANGPFTQKLEEKFAKWIGTKYAVACSSGTAAIHLAITSLGLEPGDEIIIPDFTIICSASMPILAGLKPVLVDVDEYWCMDPTKIEEKITKKTKVIMPVHMYGNPANMEPILKIARKHGLLVIEDACAAHGAEVGGKKVGSMGDVGCFSFYSSKNITSGEGGAIVTNNEKVAQMAKLLRSQAFEKPRFFHRFLGFNYRMTDIQAAIAFAQMENVNKKVAKRREIAKNYTRLLKGVKEISFHPEPPWGKSTFWMFGILINKSFGRNRDEVIEMLNRKGIGAERFYYSMSQQPIFLKEKNSCYPNVRGKYPVSQDIARRGLYIPSGLGLSLSDQKRVVKELLSLIKK